VSIKTPEEMADIAEEWATNWEKDLDDSDTILKQTPVTAAPQWISVKQQMPDVHEEVLVNIVYPIERIEKLAYRFEGNKVEWFVLPDPQGYFWNEEWITHWMPLPEPPKEEG
jgi:hypothetical protein